MKKSISFLPFFLLFLFIACSGHTDKLEQAERMMEKHPDSALTILHTIPTSDLHTRADKALYGLLYTRALIKHDTIPASDSLISLATDYFDENEPLRAGYAWYFKSKYCNEYADKEHAIAAIAKALDYAQQADDNKLLGLVFADKAMMYYSQNNYEPAIAANKRAQEYFKQSKDSYNVIVCKVRIGDIYTYKLKPDSAIVYFHEAENLSRALHDSVLLSVIYKNLGRAYSQKFDYHKALYIYRQVPAIANDYFNSNKNLLLADAFFNLHQLDSAFFYLNKMGEHRNEHPYYSSLYMKAYEQKGNYEKALKYARQVIRISDSISRKNLDVSYSGLEKKYNYQQLQLRNRDLILKSKKYMIGLLVLLLGLTLILLIAFIWKNRIKKQQIETQSLLLLQEQELLVRESHNRELVEAQCEKEKQLYENTLTNTKLIELQLKFQRILFMNIEQYKRNVHRKPQDVHPCESPVANPAFFEELVACMDLEYNDISTRLSLLYPDLSDKDILICCLVLAGFDSGMIASVLGIQADSVIKSRYRIRKRMMIKKHEKMEDYLRNL